MVAEPKKKAKKPADGLSAGSLLDGEIREPVELKNPDAKPGDADFDWSTEYVDEVFMVFTAKDGTTVGLAAPSGKRKMVPGDFRKMSHMEGWQQTFYLIEKVASPAALTISDTFDDEDYSAMMKAWTDWSGTSQGES